MSSGLLRLIFKISPVADSVAKISGAGNRIRTDDLRITNAIIYIGNQ